MDPATAPAAQPSNDAPAEAAPDYSSPNDLDFEMSAEEEQAFVDATLGNRGAKNASVPEDTTPSATPPVDPVVPPVEPDIPADPVTPPTAPETPTVPESAVPAVPAQPAPAAPTELVAPQTDDLWVEVQDSEGKDVKLVFDPTNPAAFLPAGFTFKDDNQLFEIMEAKAEMAGIYKDRESEYNTEVEKREADATATEQTTNSQAEQTAAWDAEIQDLITGGLLEAPKITDANDPKFLEDPTIAKVDAVFKYMAEQNIARAAENKPLLRSFGTAYNLYNKNSEAAIQEAKIAEANKLAKARGALVGGTSAPSSAGEAPIYVAGSAKSMYEAAHQANQ